MHSGFHLWRYSIFTRLMLTFLLIMLPIYLIALTIYNWGIRNVQNELESSTRSQMSFYLTNIETEIQRINSQLYNMLYDDNLADISNTTESIDLYSKLKLINGLQQRLFVIQNSNFYLKNVTAYIPSAGIDVSAIGGRDDFSLEEYTYYNTVKPTSMAQWSFHNNNFVLRALMPLELSYRMEKSVQMLSAVVSIEQIRSAMKKLDTLPDSGAILFNQTENYSISSRSDPELEQLIEQQVDLRLNDGSQGSMTLKLAKKEIYVMYLKSEYLNAVMVKYVPMVHFTKAVHQFRLIFWLFAAVSMIIIIIFSFSTFKFIQQPMLKLVKSLKRLEKGDLNFVIQHRRKDEYGYLYHRFNEMVKNLNQLIDEVYKQQILTQRAELKQLQSQINPHFLYNTYFILYNMVMSEDYENVRQFTNQLGTYLQYITRNAANDMPLSEEVNHARMYCDIQTYRFFNRIRIEFEELPEEFRNVMVPRMILQPILENAFKYGLEDMKGEGLLHVRFLGSEYQLSVIIEDNGSKASDEEISKLNEKLNLLGEHDEVTAIFNIHKRLQLKFRGNSGITLSRGELGGLRVCLRLEWKGD